ncbi:hypothetical protein [Nitrososphaera sp.]|uniref:hypothetical protein n=1 Tax=Nitrososphaera sp. TaxID=1971748 RepID=UPI00307F26C1
MMVMASMKIRPNQPCPPGGTCKSRIKAGEPVGRAEHRRIIAELDELRSSRWR